MKKILFFIVVLVFSTTMFAAKIDLAISASDVSISPLQPKSGDSVTVGVKVHSQGTKASKASIVKLKITKGKTKIFAQKNSIPSIAVGESYDTVFNVGALQEGTYTLLVKVDPANAIPETNEGNNNVTSTLVVGGGGAEGELGKVSLNIVASTLDSSTSVFDSIGGVGGRKEKVSLKEKIFSFFNFYKNLEDTISCTKSGSKTINYQLDDYMRPSIIEFFYDNCEDWIDAGSNSYIKLNGYLTIEMSYLSDNPYSPDFEKINQMVVKAGDGNPSSDTKTDYYIGFYENGSLFDSSKSDYTMTVSVFGYDDNGEPADMGMYLNGTIEDYVEGANYLMTFNNLHYDISISGNENDMTISETIAGTSSCVYDNDQSKKISVTYNNVNVNFHSTTNYEEMTFNGQMVIESPCFTGTVSVETIQPIHRVESDDCPESGKIKVTSGSKSVTITFNSNGTISIDENSDGSIDYTVPNCDDSFNYPC